MLGAVGVADRGEELQLIRVRGPHGHPQRSRAGRRGGLATAGGSQRDHRGQRDGAEQLPCCEHGAFLC
jgi:hypothetical protein